jgi:hypothetical protein
MDTTSFKDEFHRLLGRLVHATAVFDFNVGLQLLNSGVFTQNELDELLNPCTTQLKKRLVALKKVVQKTFHSAEGKANAEFSEWFDCADNCRVLRNDYVHGRWGVPGKYKLPHSGSAINSIPLLSFLPLTWETSPDKLDEEIVLSVEEFAQQVKVAEQLISKFWVLHDRYISHSRYKLEN